MDRFIDAYNMGRQAARLDFEKQAGAKDVAMLLKTLGEGASAGASGLGKALKGALGGAELTGKGMKYLGTTADPRAALGIGTALAGGAALIPAVSAFETHGLAEALKAGTPGALAALGGGLAMGANPGLMGGSMANRLTHELAMAGATPAGQVATMAALVGLPAALIGYGKKKGREESSWI
jgi:hypothetical protein